MKYEQNCCLSIETIAKLQEILAKTNFNILVTKENPLADL